MGTLTHPGGEKRTEEQAISEELVGADATRFRAVAARANYLAAGRPDIQYVVKEISPETGLAGDRPGRFNRSREIGKSWSGWAGT